MLVEIFRKCAVVEWDTGLPLELRRNDSELGNCCVVAVDGDGTERTVVSGEDMLYLEWKYSVVDGEATVYAFDDGGEWKAHVTRRDPKVEEMGLPPYGGGGARL